MVSATSGQWVASLNASNLFNKKYYDLCSLLATTHGLCTAAKDRTLLASLTRKF
jgi:iron complex outermembrane recepter protein